MADETMSEQRAIATHLSSVWKRILGKDVSLSEDFFEAGGDYLAAIRMIAEVQKAYDVDLDVETFFAEPSIAKLAVILAETSGSSARELAHS